MVSTIKNFSAFVGHIRAEHTISDISLALEQYMDFYSSDYEDDFLDSYIGEAKKLLDDFSKQLLKFAQDEVTKKNIEKTEAES